jgi:glutamate-1-semialdehyde 2,1-aminomutase
MLDDAAFTREELRMSDENVSPPSVLAAKPSYARSRALFARAQQIIPGGIHLSGRPLVDPETSPMYFERGEGCRIWDADGREYIDYLMAFGAVLLGYARPEVEEAAYRQARNGRLLSLNHRLHADFIEALLQRFPGMEMGTFFRTGSEATTAALRVARNATGRRKVVRCGYHGWHDWCLPLEPYVPAGLSELVPEFVANDPGTLAAVLEAERGQIAAVILSPEMVLPHRPELFHQLEAMTRSHGALFIMDEVKTGMRFAPNSISERVGIVPDMLTLSKALGNGFPVAALLGRREVMQTAAGVHYSATFHGDTAAMAAALTCIRMIEQNEVQAHVHALGALLIDGLNEIVRELHVPAQAYPEPLPAMPFFRFCSADSELNKALSATFYREVLARGILLHPRHMWFLSWAHTKADVLQTLEAARAALKATKLQLL